ARKHANRMASRESFSGNVAAINIVLLAERGGCALLRGALTYLRYQTRRSSWLRRTRAQPLPTSFGGRKRSELKTRKLHIKSLPRSSSVSIPVRLFRQLTT